MIIKKYEPNFIFLNFLTCLHSQKKNMKKISKEIKKVLKVSALKCLCNNKKVKKARKV